MGWSKRLLAVLMIWVTLQSPCPATVNPIEYTRVKRDNAVVHILRVDPHRTTVSIGLAGTKNRLARTSTIARKYGATAAVNGSFFVPTTRTAVGLIVANKQILSTPFGTRSIFAIGHDQTSFISPNAKLKATIVSPDDHSFNIHFINQPASRNGITLYTHHFGSKTNTKPHRLRREYAVTQSGYIYSVRNGNQTIPPNGFVISTYGQTTIATKSHIKTYQSVMIDIRLLDEWVDVMYAIGGGPQLVRGGKLYITSHFEKFPPYITYGRAPRTAIGYDHRGKILFVVVDGRSRKSRGVTLDQLAYLMIKLGATHAMNLDGGGSSTMYYNGKVVNQPSTGCEAPVFNALLITPNKKY